MTLRPLSLSDLPLLQRIGRASYEPYYAHLWHEGGMAWYLDRCFNAETLTRELQDPNIQYYAIDTVPGLVAGMLKLVLQQSPPPSIVDQQPFQEALYVEKIYLLPEFLGKGLGQMVLSEVAQQAKALGKKALWLQVMHSGPIAAYEKAGFQKMGESRYLFDLLRVEESGAWVMLKVL